MCVPLVTTRAIPASKVALDSDEVADFVGGYALAHAHDHPTGFVSGDGAERHVFSAPLVPFPNVNVRSANRRGLGFDQHFTRSG